MINLKEIPSLVGSLKLLSTLVEGFFIYKLTTIVDNQKSRGYRYKYDKYIYFVAFLEILRSALTLPFCKYVWVDYLFRRPTSKDTAFFIGGFPSGRVIRRLGILYIGFEILKNNDPAFGSYLLLMGLKEVISDIVDGSYYDHTYLQIISSILTAPITFWFFEKFLTLINPFLLDLDHIPYLSRAQADLILTTFLIWAEGEFYGFPYGFRQGALIYFNAFLLDYFNGR